MHRRRRSERLRSAAPVAAAAVALLAVIVTAGTCAGSGRSMQSDGEVGELRARSASLADSLRAAHALTERQSLEKDLLVREVHSFDEFMLQLQGEFHRVHALEREAGALDPRLDPLSSMESERSRILEETRATRLRLTTLENDAERRGRELETLRENVRASAERALTADSSADSSRFALASVRLLVHDLRTRIDDLQQQVDSLTSYARELHAENTRLSTALAERAARDSAVYYVVGTRRELMDWRIAREVGGMPVTGWGKVLQPTDARDTTHFITTRMRDRVIMLDSTRTYQIISGQSAGALATPLAADGSFRGPLRIRDPEAFWRSGKWLVILER